MAASQGFARYAPYAMRYAQNKKTLPQAVIVDHDRAANGDCNSKPGSAAAALGDLPQRNDVRSTPEERTREGGRGSTRLAPCKAPMAATYLAAGMLLA